MLNSWGKKRSCDILLPCLNILHTSFCVVGKPEVYLHGTIECEGEITKTGSFWCRNECVVLLGWHGIHRECEHIKTGRIILMATKHQPSYIINSRIPSSVKILLWNKNLYFIIVTLLISITVFPKYICYGKVCIQVFLFPSFLFLWPAIQFICPFKIFNSLFSQKVVSWTLEYLERREEDGK